MSRSATLWAVEVTTGLYEPMIIGQIWDDRLMASGRNWYPGEPTRTLLFCTRKHAAAWCAVNNAEHRSRPKNNAASTWRFRPVRVRETVEVMS